MFLLDENAIYEMLFIITAIANEWKYNAEYILGDYKVIVYEESYKDNEPKRAKWKKAATRCPIKASFHRHLSGRW